MKKNLSNNNDININSSEKDIETNIMESFTPSNGLNFSDMNCSTKDLLKEKDKKIQILQEQMEQLQKMLEQQKLNKNNNSNNTSTNFPLKSEIKKIWEEFALASLLDNFIDFEKNPDIIFNFVCEMVLISDKLISDLCQEMYQKMAQSLNIYNDKNFICDIEKTSRPLIKDHLNKAFAMTNNQEFFDKFIKLFQDKIKLIYNENEEINKNIDDIVENEDFKLMIKKIKDIILFTKFNDQQLYFNIEKDFNKRKIEKIKLKNNSEKKQYLIINDNNKENVDAVIILNSPVLRSGFPLNNDFKSIAILCEKEWISKSHQNLPNLNKVKNMYNKISNNHKRKVNKFLGLHIKKMLPMFNNLENINFQLKTEDLESNCRNNNILNSKEKIINTFYQKKDSRKLGDLKYDIKKSNNYKINFDINCNNTQNENNKDNNNIRKNEFKSNVDSTIKKLKNFSNSNYNRPSDKMSTNSDKIIQPIFNEQLLKNNTSENLLENRQKEFINSNSSKNNKYNNNKKIEYNSYKENYLITYNYDNMKSDLDEDNKNKKMIYHTNTSKDIFNNSDNFNSNKDFDLKDDYDVEQNNKENIYKKINNFDSIDNLNRIYFNMKEKNSIYNLESQAYKLKLKEKLNNTGSKINKNRIKEPNQKTKMRYKDHNSNDIYINNDFKKINSQKRPKILNERTKKKIENYYKIGDLYKNCNNDNSENNSKFRITSTTTFNQQDMKYNFHNEKDVYIFKKNRTTNFISNSIKNNNLNKNSKDDFKEMSLKNKQNNSQTNRIKKNDKKAKNKNPQKYYYFNQKKIDNKKIKRKKKYKKNLLNDVINIKNFELNKTKTIDNNNDNNSGNINKVFYRKKEKRILLSPCKNNNLLIDNNNRSSINQLNKERYSKNKISLINNNISENNNFYDINDLNDMNSTDYKIKNVNINYFNIMQPNKLYINQNSTRSKSRLSDCNKNKIMINYNNFNKNSDNDFISNKNYKKIINYNNINNRKVVFNKYNTNKKAESKENNNRFNKSNYFKLDIKNANQRHNSKNLNYKNKNALNIITDINNIQKQYNEINNENEPSMMIKGNKFNNQPRNFDEYKSENYIKNDINQERKEIANSFNLNNINNLNKEKSSRKNNKSNIKPKIINFIKRPQLK